MKKQLTQLLQKTYFYQHEGKDGSYSLYGSGNVTTWRWVPFQTIYDEVRNGIIAKAAIEYPDRNFNPWFTRFERIK